MEFEIIVQPKREVLDPQARAILDSLQRMGFASISKVEVSKRYILTITDLLPEHAEAQALSIAKQHLANPIAETFQLKRL